MEEEVKSNYTVHIKEQQVRNEKYFVYHDKEYPVDFSKLKLNSNYFYKFKKQFSKVKKIKLIDKEEEENGLELSEDCIRLFISCCHNEECSISKSSVIGLQYLARKYDFPALMKVTSEIISKHWNDILLPSILFKNYSEQMKSNKNAFFDTSKEEEFISTHLEEYINKEEMLELPIPCVHRILKQFYSNRCANERNASDVTIFLFKYLDKHGKRASILFNIVDFGKEKRSVVNRLLEEYSETFDFSMINQTLTKTVKELTSELTKQKEEYSKLFLQMKEAFERQVGEVNKIKEEAKERQVQDEIQRQERNQGISEEIQAIKNEVDSKMNQIETKFGQICKKQEDLIDNNAMKKYNQITLSTVSVEQFLKLDKEMKEYFVKELQKNTAQSNNQDEFNKRMHLLQLIVSVKFLSEKENICAAQLIKDDIKVDHLRIDVNGIENIYEKGLIQPILTHCFSNCNNFTVDVEYPCSQFENIMKTILEIKRQHQEESEKMKIYLVINKENYFEQGFRWNSIVDECLIGPWFTGINKKQAKHTYDFSEIEKVNLSNGITSINAYAFSDCTTLKHVSIPATLTQIGDYTFSGCTSLEQVTVASAEQTGERSSCGSASSTQAANASSVMKIGDYSFSGCTSLKQVKIPSSVFQIGDYSFSGCTSLAQIEIPSSVSQIGDYSFSGCTSLAQIEIPSSVAQIGEHCFDGCAKLSRLGLNPFYTQIKSNSFSNCHSMNDFTVPTAGPSKASKSNKNVLIPSFMTEFMCKKNILNSSEIASRISDLSEINIEIEYPSGDFSNTLQKVASVKRANSSKIKIIVIYTRSESGTDPHFYENKEIDCDICVRFDSKVKEVPDEGSGNGHGLFEKCSSLSEVIIPSSMTRIGNRTFFECKTLKRITFEQPSLMEAIGNDVFRGCSSLTQITIPSNVTSIGNNAFYDCSSLAQITFQSPSSLNTIGYCAFQNCKSLKQMTIPSTVASIGNHAFYDCSSLTQITIPSNVTSIDIDAFRGCSSLTQITIPSNVTSISEYEFYDCSSLAQVIFQSPSSLNTIGYCAFYNCKSLKQMTIPSTVTSIGGSAFYYCISLTQITIPSYVTSIVQNEFSGCSSLTQITIPSNVTSIGANAFCGCSSLTQITIPSNVTSIDIGAFRGCSSLTQITFQSPSSLNTIGSYVFENCKSLKQMTIPSNVTSIGEYTFNGCSSLTQITIPSNVTSIGHYAFAYCSSLTQITIPSNVTSIGHCAFSGCHSLTQVTIPSRINTSNLLIPSSATINRN